MTLSNVHLTIKLRNLITWIDLEKNQIDLILIPFFTSIYYPTLQKIKRDQEERLFSHAFFFGVHLKKGNPHHQE